MDSITRTCIYVAIGMLIEVALTLLIYLLSRKFHPSFGVLPANLFGTDAEKRVKCSRGWEWWLSITWQFFWAWIYAPCILWKSRRIQDTHGWRLQTALCCLAGLPCSPLWLCGLYLAQFAPVNQYFLPPLWFSVSFFFLELFTVFIPLYQVLKQHKLRGETLKAITDWEAKSIAFGSIDSDSTTIPASSQECLTDSERDVARARQVDTSSISSRKSHLYTMVALEHALRWNAEPLQKFAALKDFSGENINFLTHLANWQKGWAKQNRERHSFRLPSQESDIDEKQLRKQFNQATRLYAAFISSDLAVFPINISSGTLKALEQMFGKPAELLFGDTRSNNSSNSATPFLDEKCSVKIDIEAISPVPYSTQSDNDAIYYWGEIPQSFSSCCFDDAEKEIKYLVLTNTWPKFVHAGLAEHIQDGQGRTLDRQLSQLFLWPRRTCKSDGQ